MSLQPALTLVRHARLLGPPETVQNLLIGNGRIIAASPDLELPVAPTIPVESFDLEGRRTIPGLVDLHVHLAGGGGEGGFVNRTPPMTVSALAAAGTTTAVGLLGTDGLTRSVAGLFAHARALAAEGISTRIFTGAYEVPTRTLTGSLRSDLVFIREVVGTGEIAISDDRSSHPSEDDLAHLAAETRVGALLAGKPGLVHLHVGNGRNGLTPLLKLLRDRDLPPRLFLPTHVNRRPHLLDQAEELLALGGGIDLTAGIEPNANDRLPVTAAHALAQLLDRCPTASAQITLSSDAGGSTPTFDDQGTLISIDVGRPEELWRAVRQASESEGVPLSMAVATVTRHPAHMVGLTRKGTVAVGFDADLIALNEDLTFDLVMAKGKIVARGGKPQVAGPFDLSRSRDQSHHE